MKRTLFLTVILLTAVIMPLYAADVQERGYITVNTEATKELDPTTAKVSFGVETKGKDAQTAADSNKETSQKIIDEVKKLIDEEKGESIKTSSYYLNPEYSRTQSQRTIAGYSATNTVEVTLKDTSKTGKIISTALSNGANRVSGLNFSLENTDSACNELIQIAAKSARTRAEEVAKSLSSSITGIKNINAGCSNNTRFYANYAMTTKAADSVSLNESTPVEAGKTQLRAYVNADFFVK